MGWFTIPATRAMFAHTKVYGLYQGDEIVNEKKELFSEVNILNHYAETKNVTVYVTDDKNIPVENAFVDFQVYNYAEFYPLTRKLTTNEGKAEFITGHGDLLIWAGKENNFAYRKISVESTDSIKLILNNVPGKEYFIDMDFLAPTAVDRKDGDKGDKDISKRLNNNNTKRARHEETYMLQEEAYLIADNQNFDREIVWNFINLSYGNWEEMARFCGQNTDLSRPWVLDFLGTLSKKDLRDINYDDIFFDHLNNIKLFRDSIYLKYDRDIFLNYILCPRIENESLRPYKNFLQIKFGDEFINNSRKDINVISNWIRSNIEISKEANYYSVAISPRGIYELKAADQLSTKIFFIACCRSFGIPARYDKSSGSAQYYSNGEWQESFLFKDERSSVKAILSLINHDKTLDPEYYIHFTIARFENGKYHTIKFDHNKKLSSFPESIELDPGNYMLVTGTRQAQGNVMGRMEFFNLFSGESKDVNIELRGE